MIEENLDCLPGNEAHDTTEGSLDQDSTLCMRESGSAGANTMAIVGHGMMSVRELLQRQSEGLLRVMREKERLKMYEHDPELRRAA